MEEHLPALRERYDADLAIVNGENAADGAGITAKLADKLLAAGADVVTLGNHTYRRSGIASYLAASERVIRPANSGSRGAGPRPRRGRGAERRRRRRRQPARPALPTDAGLPWEIVDALVEEARRAAPVVVVDFHAEATSEKVAIATWLDGRVTAVIGTHTHIQTNDARVLPGGTAAISDAGMTGPHDSVIGVRSELAIAPMRTRLPSGSSRPKATCGWRASSSRAPTAGRPRRSSSSESRLTG